MQDVFTTHKNSIESLQRFIISNNIDVRTWDKFKEATRNWLIEQIEIDKKVEQMPISDWKIILNLND